MDNNYEKEAKERYCGTATYREHEKKANNRKVYDN